MLPSGAFCLRRSPAQSTATRSRAQSPRPRGTLSGSPPAPERYRRPWLVEAVRTPGRESPPIPAAAGEGSGGSRWPTVAACCSRSFRTPFLDVAKEAGVGVDARLALACLLWLQLLSRNRSFRLRLWCFGQVGDIQAVVVVAPLALVQNCRGDLLQR